MGTCEFKSPVYNFDNDQCNWECYPAPECETGTKCNVNNGQTIENRVCVDKNNFDALKHIDVDLGSVRFSNGVFSLRGREPMFGDQAKMVIDEREGTSYYFLNDELRFSIKDNGSLGAWDHVADKMARERNFSLQAKERRNQLNADNGINELSGDDLYSLFGRKEPCEPKGASDARKCSMADHAARKDPRRIMVVMPHQDDETAIAGTLKRLSEQVGGENIKVLYITNDDGLAWDKTQAERAEFGETKMALGRESCASLGIPEENVSSLPGSEVSWYNGFITPNVSKISEEKNGLGDERLAGLPEDFRLEQAMPDVAYRTAEWVYRNMKDFRPDVIITGDRMYTVQMHDWTNILTRLAARQYVREEGVDMDVYSFPQQNTKPGEETRYAWYPISQKNFTPIYRIDLTEKEQDAKSEAAGLYMSATWTDKMLMYGYGGMMLAKCAAGTLGYIFGGDDERYRGYCEYSAVEYLRPGDLNVVVECPAPEFLGFREFEGNDEHYGVPHSCEDDFTNILKPLLNRIEAQPFTQGPAETFDPFIK